MIFCSDTIEANHCKPPISTRIQREHTSSQRSGSLQAFKTRMMLGDVGLQHHNHMTASASWQDKMHEWPSPMTFSSAARPIACLALACCTRVTLPLELLLLQTLSTS
eukprot:193066-Amphidinium_carterae.1